MSQKAPQVYNIYKEHPKDCVFIGRPTVFGNPFKMGIDGDREEVVKKFEDHVLRDEVLTALIKNKLKGRNLVCYCAPKKCHGDILLKIANQP
jgi:hypothetical protein